MDPRRAVGVSSIYSPDPDPDNRGGPAQKHNFFRDRSLREILKC